MCGIIGYTGTENAVPILLNGLKTLEYRGYDSAGIAVQTQSTTAVVKTKGRLADLQAKLDSSEPLSGTCGIGHTRWATHGAPSDVNSHPHTTDKIALVHNGIIENYAELEEMLKKDGYTFYGETDTEVAAKLIDLCYRQTGDPVKTIFKAISLIRGSYAFGIVFSDIPDTVYAIRQDSPLIVAASDNGNFIASDIPAILAYTRQCYRLPAGVLATLKRNGISFTDENMMSVSLEAEQVNWDVEQARKGGFAHFMLKEINEEPGAVEKTVLNRYKNGKIRFGIPELDGELIKKFRQIHIVACGTAMHAGLVGKNVIERLARVPVNVELASEFRYCNPILHPDDLVILISQSGETADTLAALRHAKLHGIYTLAIVNVVGSAIALEADGTVYTYAGPEIAVASTKAYTVQCAVLYLLALRLANASGRLNDSEVGEYMRALVQDVPLSIKSAIAMSDDIAGIAERYKNAHDIFFIGRGVDKDLCAEGSLKLKEISYIHCEGYAAGELKHGTISLITEDVPVIAVMTVSAVAEKTISGIREVKSRGARVLAVCSEEIAGRYEIPCDDMITVSSAQELYAPFGVATVLQLLAYHVSDKLGLDVDKPRNLAKSVTVE